MFDLEEGFDPLNRECYCDLKRHALAWKHDTMPAKVQRDPKNKVKRIKCRLYICVGWLSCRVVSVLDSGAEGPGFKSRPRRCRVTVLGKLFTPIAPLFTKQRNR